MRNHAITIVQSRKRGITGTVGLVISFLRSDLERACSRITFQHLSLHRSPVRRAGLFGIRSVNSLLPYLVRAFGLAEL
jgi:hypothetical protein